MSRTRIKICGIASIDDAKLAVDAGAVVDVVVLIAQGAELLHQIQAPWVPAAVIKMDRSTMPLLKRVLKDAPQRRQAGTRADEK